MNTTTPILHTEWVRRAEDIGADLHPLATIHDQTGAMSPAVFDALRAGGLTTALVPAEFGGGGAKHADMGAILRSLGRHDPSVGVTLAMHSHLVALQTWRHHRGMDASAVFRRVVDDGAVLISTGASDWLGSNGTATKVDGGFRVSARKAPASGCEHGQVAVTSIRWDGAPDGPQVIHGSIPMSAPGVSIEHSWDTLGLRATGSHTIVFDDVFIPDAAVSLVRPADVWHPIWNAIIGAAMPLIMSAYVGIADAAVNTAIGLSVGRTDAATLTTLGEMSNAHVTAGDLVDAMFRETADLRFDNTNALASRILSRKTVAANAVVDTARLAIEAVGGRGFSRGQDLERLLRDAHGAGFHPLPRAKQIALSGRVAVGLEPVG